MPSIVFISSRLDVSRSILGGPGLWIKRKIWLIEATRPVKRWQAPTLANEIIVPQGQTFWESLHKPQTGGCGEAVDVLMS
jgi:hypothetical protein